MMMLVKFIGIFITAMGIAILFNPKVAKRMMAFWRQGKNIYIGGLIRLALGGVLVYCSSYAKLPQVLLVLGILAILGGLLIFILGPNKSKAMIDRAQRKPDNFLRLVSLLAIVFGVLIIFSA
jgi:uncharacterized protein YjeT (DUF2065 family)